MKKEEVTKWLTIMKANLNSFPEINCGKKIEALAEAIRLLKNEQSIDKIDCDHTDCINCVNHKYCDYEKSSSEIPNKSEIDCISREQALDLLCKKCPVYDCTRKCISYKAIEKMLSSTPIRPKGRWIEERNDYGEIEHWHCSNCYDDSGFITTCKWDYCPNCGAEMRTSEENDV